MNPLNEFDPTKNWGDYDSQEYGENNKELVERMRAVQNNYPTWRDKKWKREDVDAALSVLEPLAYQEVININDLWRVIVDLGKFSRKLDLTGGPRTASTLRHTYGLLLLAKFLIEEGNTVHLLEGVDSTGVHCKSDLDLLYSNDHAVYFCDYTQLQGQKDTDLYVFERDHQQLKYSKLESIRDKGSDVQVVSFGLNGAFECEFDVTINRNSSRESDFDFADHCVGFASSLTLSEAKMILDDFSEKINAYTGMSLSKVIETSSLHARDLTTDEEVLNMLKSNNESVAGMYTKWLDTVGTDSQNYSKTNYPDVCDMELKPNIPFPECVRGHAHRDPFDRAKSIMDEGIAEGKSISCFLKALSGLKTEVLIDETFQECFDYDYMVGSIFKRSFTKKDEPMKCFELEFGAGDYSGYQQYLKGILSNQRQRLSMMDMESILNNSWKVMKEQGVGSRHIEELSQMCDEVLDEGNLSRFCRTFLSGTGETFFGTRLASNLSFVQEVTLAILASPAKRKILRGHVGGYSQKRCVFSIEAVSDRKAIVINNIGPVAFGDLTQVSYQVLGLFEPNSQLHMSRHDTTTRVLSMSHTHMDWNSTLLHKITSWVMLCMESRLAGHLKEERLDTMDDTIKLPCFLSFLNNNRFSQVSENARYFFVNGVSLTSGPGPLFEKIQWYKPDTIIEALYLKRLFKMSDMLALAKKKNMLSTLKSTYFSTERSTNTVRKMTMWDIAMPDETVCSHSEQRLFNSFYVCRAVTIQRYNKIMSESLIVQKQLSAREEYIKIKSENRQHEGRFQVKHNLKETMMEELIKTEYNPDCSGPWSPDPKVLMMGYLATILKLSLPAETKVAEVNHRVYKLNQVLYDMDVSSIMNNRGSVRDDGENGYIISNLKTTPKITQNSKCYRTILELATKMSKKHMPTQLDPSYPQPSSKMTIENVDLERVVRLPDKAWPLVIYTSSNNAACVSKCVHKDQLGAREIAVLNANSRVMCRYVEDLARKVRDDEHSAGLKTNLIEKKSKLLIVKEAMRRGVSEKVNGRNLAFDSADCSKWGPSMMPHAMYQSLSHRMENHVYNTILRNCLALFSMKVFKIPDALYNTDEEKLTHTQRELIDKLKNMSTECGDFEKQLFYLEESMHQGILGCSSSVLGSDAQNLSNYVTDRNHRDYNLKTSSYITSDDYSRVLTWKGDVGIFSIGKTSLRQHISVLLLFGIKRNTVKSGLSSDYFEFNSVFLTFNGEYRPDVKSRLAYVDYGYETDMYSLALRSSKMAEEFLRSEGSFIGSCWVALLNNHLTLIQNQMTKLYREIGGKIYSTPLELGGLVRPNPIKGVLSLQQLSLLENYGYSGDLRATLKTILNCESLMPNFNDDNTLKVPSLSHGNFILSPKRPKRTERAIREYLMSINTDLFMEIYRGNSTSSYVLTLMACSDRERLTSNSEGSASNYLSDQFPFEAAIIKINKSMHGFERSQMISRKDIFAAAKDYVHVVQSHDEEYLPLDYESMKTDLKIYETISNTLTPLEIVNTPRYLFPRIKSDFFCQPSYTDKIVLAAKEKFLPVSFGGAVDIHPWLYLEAMTMLKQKSMKLTMRKQTFNMCLNFDDVDKMNWTEMILTSNFVSGCRMNFQFNPVHEGRAAKTDDLQRILKIDFSNLKYNPNGVLVNIMNPDIVSMSERDRIRGINITELMNFFSGDPMYYCRDSLLKELVISHIKLHSDTAMFFVIPTYLTLNFGRDSYRSSTQKSINQQMLMEGSRRVGRELIFRDSGKYKHYLIATDGEVESRCDTNTDEYLAINYTHEPRRVMIDEYWGFSVLRLHSRYFNPLQIISKYNIDFQTLRLYTSKRLDQYEDDIQDLARIVNRTVAVPRLVEMMNIAQGTIIEATADETPHIDYDSEVEYGDGYDEDDSDDELFGFSATDILHEHTELLLKIDNDNQQALFEDSDEEEEHRDSESLDNISRGDARPVSEARLFLPPASQLIDLTKGSITVSRGRDVQFVSKKINKDIKYCYEIQLPLKLKTGRIVEKPGESGLKLLLSIASENESIAWLKDYIIDTLKMYPPIRSTLVNILSVERTIENIDINDEKLDEDFDLDEFFSI